MISSIYCDTSTCCGCEHRPDFDQFKSIEDTIVAITSVEKQSSGAPPLLEQRLQGIGGYEVPVRSFFHLNRIEVIPRTKKQRTNVYSLKTTSLKYPTKDE